MNEVNSQRDEKESISSFSDKNLARLAGLFYLLVIGTGLFSEVFVRQALSVSNDAYSTAHTIQTHELLYRWGLVADIFNFVIGIPAVLIIYSLFKRYDKLLVQIALAFVIIQTAIIAVNLLNQIAPLLLLGNETYLSTLEDGQLATLSLFFLNMQIQGYAIGLVFFGFYCLIIGYMIYTYNMIPRIFGLLYAIAGLCYLVNSFTMFLSEGFKNPYFVYLAIPIFIGELSFCLWLLIKGVNTLNLKERKLE